MKAVLASGNTELKWKLHVAIVWGGYGWVMLCLWDRVLMASIVCALLFVRAFVRYLTSTF